uniref:Reverse transcriptase domain-containing protein n=1 Tax=Tanacetum cinerariifolium TaxID=118510 RepID=A0A6L2K7U7_TANCI|nr:reverse transcriptase domain-containing protein [Tanacetum cinerariifolium]
MSWEDFRTLTREEFCPSNEMQKLKTKLWNHAMVRVGHAAYTDMFHELARLVPHLVTPKSNRIGRKGTIKRNHEKRENIGEPSKDSNGREDNKRTRTRNAFAMTANLVRGGYIGLETRGNQQNQVVAVNGGQGRRNQRNHARGKAFMLGAEEAHQDPNIVTDIEPNDLGFSYEIEIASGQLVELNKVIWGCKLEIKVRIPLLNGKVLRVLRKKSKEKKRQLMSAKAKKKKQEEIVVVIDFLKDHEEHEYARNRRDGGSVKRQTIDRLRNVIHSTSDHREGFGPGLHKVIHRPKPGKTIKKYNGPKLSSCQTGYDPEAARWTKDFQRTLR